mmetsp:Transcript_27686/g.36001  ORF Transcript_27686/g.36001 Transcript_27686/m.36001 type:complete len:510 (+) Transcript_27686:232-1761(+)
MKLNVKTLDGKNFSVDVEDSKTFAEVKTAIEQARGDLPADNQKLIHSGKILKDDQTIQEVNIKETDFIVCMVKPKKATRTASPAPAPAAAAAPAPAPAAAGAAAPSTPAPAAAPATPAAPERPAGAAAASATPTPSAFENPETVQNLVDMGFPDDQVRAALRAAMGNGDVAVEFLMNGIPDNLQAAASGATPAAAAAAAAGAGGSSTGTGHPLDALRNHPQLNALKRLVQSNPGALQQVLQQIGAQSPDLLATIHQHQEEFVKMMNEPIDESAPTPAAGAGGAGGLPGLGGAGGGMNPAIMAQVMRLASLPEAQRAQVARQLGMTPEMMNNFSNLVRSLPPEQLQQILAGVGSQMGGGAGGAPPGAQVVRLTQEELASVNRLTEMGFERNTVMQAYLACDRDEALAANLLMDGMGFEDEDTFPSPAGPTPAAAQTPAPAPAPAAAPASESAAPAPAPATESANTETETPASAEASPSEGQAGSSDTQQQPENNSSNTDEKSGDNEDMYS